MRIIQTVEELQARSRAWRAAGEAIGFVPTMGALHDGHLSLVAAARRHNRRVVASVFVNPTQFNDRADLDAYPRDFDRDARLLEAAGVDAVFHPDVKEMYPSGEPAGIVKADRVGAGYEGAHRRGHFDGVATIVSRLFDAALPDRAYFGRKDAQQLAVIRAMARDVGLGVEIVGCPTVREPDGLAMSSRNVRLGGYHRAVALGLVQSLAGAQLAFANGDRDSAAIAGRTGAALAAVTDIEVDYAAVVNAGTFETPAVADPEDLAIVAAHVGGVRLIDNVQLGAGDVIQFAPAIPPAVPEGVMS